ncbi:hypothetical protein AYO44_09015 [Planctomycetaceae bacterium SCGC AG-212-F19]|nr:hypothetical protein AYO44_09015 [Planctomycetaceae bacterium SCGC AG-212-F19]
MRTGELSNYGPVIGDILREQRVAPLGPGSPNEAARAALQQATLASTFAHARVQDRAMAECCLAGLWLYHDFIDEAHKICQEVDTPTGSYWHGIVHRREPDYSNAKYWFRRVGTHPVFTALYADAKAMGTTAGAGARFLTEQPAWDPFAFIDLCERSAGGRGTEEPLCRQIQQREWGLLFGHCYRRAVGG